MRVDIAIVCATRISQHVSSSRKSEVQISDPAVLNHTRAFLNKTEIGLGQLSSLDTSTRRVAVD